MRYISENTTVLQEYVWSCSILQLKRHHAPDVLYVRNDALSGLFSSIIPQKDRLTIYLAVFLDIAQESPIIGNDLISSPRGGGQELNVLILEKGNCYDTVFSKSVW